MMRFKENCCYELLLLFHVTLLQFSTDSEVKDKEELLESQGVPENSSHLSSASSHGRRIRWLLSSASLGNIEEEVVSFEPRLESSASGATLEVRINVSNILFIPLNMIALIN